MRMNMLVSRRYKQTPPLVPRPYDYRSRDWHGRRIDTPDMRRVLHDGGLGRVEHYSVSEANVLRFGYSPDHQFTLPVFGAHTWKVRGTTSLIDCNTALFVRGGEEFSETHPISGVGHSAVILTPSASLVDELGCGRKAAAQAVFRADSRPSTPRAQLLAHHLVSRGADMSALEIEERSLEFIYALLAAEPSPSGAGCRRVADKAMEMLHDLDTLPLSVPTMAAEIGVTPIYLTQAFKRCEGMPLYRYQMRLRLARALSELPFRTSLIDLALELGFSSDSHFASTFRSVYGVTPSNYRDAVKI